MHLFRAISNAEHEDLLSNGFRPGTNSLEGKWFAESFENALSWGNLLYDGRNFLICSIELSDSVYSGLFRLTNLDGIGPAVYAEITDLQYATITNFSIVK
ncbi:MAG: hypothetical protein AAFY36_06665 [Bacteroidota bacterium]